MTTPFDWPLLRHRIAEARAGAARRESERLEALWQRRARQLRHQPDGDTLPDAGTIPVLTVRVGGEWLALPLAQLSDAIPGARITPVPGWPPGLPGVVNRRGSIQPVADLRTLLHLPLPTDRAPAALVLFLRSAVRSYGLLVDEAGELRRVDPAAFAPAGGHPVRSLLVVGNDADGLLLLDLSRLDAIDLFSPGTPSFAPGTPSHPPAP
ncbi:chemotaxis protein CheW [Oleisolibacter albus]|uniref:chemotaxis protein CheW n=1 Tax=Oleisolibacter albus TaxID=2171757 RepID=UPI000DF28CCC|nr:chemotaxis protein CheW [Oleisolibacter albus]